MPNKKEKISEYSKYTKKKLLLKKRKNERKTPEHINLDSMDPIRERHALRSLCLSGVFQNEINDQIKEIKKLKKQISRFQGIILTSALSDTPINKYFCQKCIEQGDINIESQYSCQFCSESHCKNCCYRIKCPIKICGFGRGQKIFICDNCYKTKDQSSTNYDCPNCKSKIPKKMWKFVHTVENNK